MESQIAHTADCTQECHLHISTKTSTLTPLITSTIHPKMTYMESAFTNNPGRPKTVLQNMQKKLNS